MVDKGVLPPLPASDPESLARGHFDNFYLRSSRDFWKGANIEYIRDEIPIRCEHNFVLEKGEVKCKKCNIGFIMNIGLSVVQGKLIYKNKQIAFPSN